MHDNRGGGVSREEGTRSHAHATKSAPICVDNFGNSFSYPNHRMSNWRWTNPFYSTKPYKMLKPHRIATNHCRQSKPVHVERLAEGNFVCRRSGLDSGYNIQCRASFISTQNLLTKSYLGIKIDHIGLLFKTGECAEIIRETSNALFKGSTVVPGFR